MSRAARGEQGQSKQSEGWQEPRCPHQLVGETGESLIAAPSVFCNWVLSLHVAKCIWHCKNPLVLKNERWNKRHLVTIISAGA